MGFVENCRKHFGCDDEGNLFRLAEPEKRVGYINKGYVKVTLRKQEISDFKISSLQAHRIIYALVKGVEADSVNHLDNPLNNRIEKLENVDHRGNHQDREIHRDGKLTGCRWDKRAKRWQARLKYNDYCLYIGYYDSEEEAHKAYDDLCDTLQKTEESLDFSIEIERILDERPGLRQKYEQKLEALLARRRIARAIKDAAAARDALIAAEYAAGGVTMRELAKMFGVDLKTVQVAIHKNL
jgi:DNA-directed RNA polymerase specialized sigma24 family protein